MPFFLKHYRRVIFSLLVGITLPLAAQASVYGGGGLLWGAFEASTIVGPLPLRFVVLNVLSVALSYMALIAVVVIVIAGIVLVVGGGEDSAKDRTKKMIMYTLIGLIIIGIAEGLVWFLLFALS